MPLQTQKLDEAMRCSLLISIFAYASSLQHCQNQKTFALLIAEDNPINCQLLETMLAPLCQLQLVHDGLAAIHACETTAFDLLILDIQMPKRSGRAVASHLRERLSAYSETPILFISANATDVSASYLKQFAIFACLQKPFDESTLLNAMLEAHLAAPPALDWALCLKNLSNNLPLVRTCLSQFLDETCDATGFSTSRSLTKWAFRRGDKLKGLRLF